jgi:hypothetical protein
MAEKARRAAMRLVTTRMGIPPERFMSTEAPAKAPWSEPFTAPREYYTRHERRSGS